MGSNTRLRGIKAVFFLFFVLISANYYRIASGAYSEFKEDMYEVKVVAGESEGTIYDRNMKPLVNSEMRYRAVAVPSGLKKESIIGYAVDREEFSENFDLGQPFVFECTEDTPQSDALTVFRIPQRYSEVQHANHAVGYKSQGAGATGIEYAYNKILRGSEGENSVTYSADGFGRVLIGNGKKTVRSSADRTGVVTSIDADIQEICENSVKGAGKGAVVVSDVNTGDILSLVSFPDYSVSDIEDALDDEDCPLINRALYSYSVGSIFKLVTSCEAISEGFERYIYFCRGFTDIQGQNFNCHKPDGHGMQNMSQALTNSCNTYFINLSKYLDAVSFRSLAYSLGFGREIFLCSGMTSSAGVLPSERELSIPAELANFSFGQGRLTATPLQVNRMTCAIANGGKLPEMRLIRGITADGKSIANEKSTQFSRALPSGTAEKVKEMMIKAVEDGENSNAKTRYTRAGAKTSTAQTGRFDKNGEEFCHAWITGFFPAEKPVYAVTVLVEDGGYGNESSAPVFREIADNIVLLEKKREIN